MDTADRPAFAMGPQNLLTQTDACIIGQQAADQIDGQDNAGQKNACIWD